MHCGVGFDGSITEERTKTTAITTYPWNETPLVSMDYTNWSETSNECTKSTDECNGCSGEPDDIAGSQGSDNGPDTTPDDDGRDRGSNMDADAITGNADDGSNDSDSGIGDNGASGPHGP